MQKRVNWRAKALNVKVIYRYPNGSQSKASAPSMETNQNLASTQARGRQASSAVRAGR